VLGRFALFLFLFASSPISNVVASQRDVPLAALRAYSLSSVL
jgi:hypothetical protein